MKSNPSGRAIGIVITWLASICVVVALVVAGLHWYGISIHFENVVATQAQKTKLLAQMNAELFKSVEAEKNAVLAVTDEESEGFAAESRQAAVELERVRSELSMLIDKGNIPEEIRLFNEFGNCWSELQKIDRVLLAFAVQNTNLKAAKLSYEEGGKDIQRIEQSLDQLMQASVRYGSDHQVPMLACTALTAALKIHYLHNPHINEASDAKMDELEKQMAALDETVKNSFEDMTRLATDPERLAILTSARNAYDDFEKVTAQVLKLSRENSNIKSFALSVGKKRTVTAQCQDTLSELQKTVSGRAFKATR